MLFESASYLLCRGPRSVNSTLSHNIRKQPETLIYEEFSRREIVRLISWRDAVLRDLF